MHNIINEVTDLPKANIIEKSHMKKYFRPFTGGD